MIILKKWFFTVTTINCVSKMFVVMKTEIQEENILPGTSLCKDKSIKGLYIFKLKEEKCEHVPCQAFFSLCAIAGICIFAEI